MSILKKPYQLSIWQIEWGSNGPKEKRIATIGSDTMTSQNKAFNPKLVRNVNGTVTLSFSMYGKYIDNITGEQTINPFIHYLHNETILKLWYDDKWYDLIIKSANENSVNNVYDFTASDLHINELSKNGFNLEINQELNNNYGTLTELGKRILKDTDWEIDVENSHCSVQTVDESLVALKLKEAIKPYFINDTKVKEGLGIIKEKYQTQEAIPAGTIVYGFYSSCKNKPSRFQFIYVKDDEYVYDDKHIITNELSQYYIEVKQQKTEDDTLPSYHDANINEEYDFIVPKQFDYYTGTDDKPSPLIPANMRGRRYVFGWKSSYNNLLERNLTRYKDINTGKECWCSTDVEYITPVVVKNLSGNTDFKSTNGWESGYIQKRNLPTDDLDIKQKPKKGTVEAGVVGDVIDNITLEGVFPTPITPYLAYSPAEDNDESVSAVVIPVLVGSGPNDNKKTIKNFAPGEKYIIMYKPKRKENITHPLIQIAYYKISEDGLYEGRSGKEIYLTFKKGDAWTSCTASDKDDVFLPAFKTNQGSTENDFSVYNGYYYQIAEIPTSYRFTEYDFQARDIQMFIIPKETEEDEGDGSCDFEDLQFFKVEYCDFDFNGTKTKTIITPKSGMIDTVVKNVYKFYTDDTLKNAKTVDNIVPYFTAEYDFPEDRFSTVYYENAEKVRSIEVKESNYFNSLQSLCENFETWVDFNIVRYNDGSIEEKKIVFKNYIGIQNYAGFKYGVNLQSISRKIDSANIVTKMIVKNNSNQAGKNGYCSIVRANANETGENCIYDFSYYINQKIINESNLINTLYNPTGAKGQDINKSDTETNCNGYYTRLKLLNTALDEEIERNSNYFLPLNQSQSNFTTAEAGKKSAEEQKLEALANFEVVAGFDLFKDESYTKDQKALIEDSQDLQKYISNYIEAEIQYQAYQEKYKDASDAITRYSELYEASNTRIDNLTEQKRALHKAFQHYYGLYIQEGTWQEEKYYDDEQYYIDALSTMRNSCFPQVQYTIQVAEISQIPGYEYYKFGLGDKTFIEDTEFFGYNSDGDPYREEIVLSEITEMLDDPSKNTITVKNYKTQFQDLFQRITASVQQTQFAQGSYAKAADLAEGSTKVKSSFLQEAMQDPALVLQNAGEQSVTWGPEGIVITDALEPSEQVRLIGGAILIKTKDENGIGTWKTAITSKGIAADLITAGRINTGEIQIMNGDQPTFRWDSLGITAYDFNTTDQGNIGKVNFSKGVRFDKFGIYGYDTNGSSNFIPTKYNINTSEQLLQNTNITFGLTWDGLKMSSNDGNAGILSNDYKHEFNIGSEKHTYGSVRFYAGANTATFMTGNDPMDANFIVTEKGYMKAVYGEIGPFNINSSGFWSGSFDNPTAGILYSDNMSYMFSTNGNFSNVNTEHTYSYGVYAQYGEFDSIRANDIYVPNGYIGPFNINSNGFWAGNVDSGDWSGLLYGYEDDKENTIKVASGIFYYMNVDYNLYGNQIFAEDAYLSNISPNRFFGSGWKEDFTINDKRILTEDDLLSSGYKLNSEEIIIHLERMDGVEVWPNGSYGTVVLGPDCDKWNGQDYIAFRSDGISLSGILYTVNSIQHYDNKEEKGFEYKLNREGKDATLKCFQYPRQWFYFPEYYSGYETAESYCSNGSHKHEIYKHFRNWYVEIYSD